MNETAHLLVTSLKAHLSPASLAWFDAALPAADPREGGLAGGGRAAFASAFAAAPRRLGKSEIALTEAEIAAWEATGLWLPPGLTLDELGRIALLAALPEAEQEPMVDECHRHGEIRERRAVLRALPLLARPERFVALAVDACRTHVQPVFEAICCDNPYPMRFFPDAALHQMVLKALFLGVPLDRIAGLRSRTTPELIRMAHGYASERRAAGRAVPADIERHFGAAFAPEERSS